MPLRVTWITFARGNAGIDTDVPP